MAELLPEISRLSEILAKDPSSRLFYPLAEEYVKNKMLEEAVQVLTDGLQRHPTFQGARVTLGKIYLEQGKIADARAAFEIVVKAHPDNLVALKKLAFIYHRDGDWAEVRRCCNLLLAVNSHDTDAAQLLREADAAEIKVRGPVEPSAARPDEPMIIERSTTPAPPSPTDTAPADTPPAAAPSAEEGDELASPTMAQLYLRQGHYDQALEIYTQLLRRDPNNETYRQGHRLAQSLLQARNPAPSSPPPAAPPAAAAPVPAAPSSNPPAEGEKAPAAGRLQDWLNRIQEQRRRAS